MLLLLAGCFTTVHSNTCETSTYEVGDDEHVGGLPSTAADILDIVVGTFAFDAAYEAGGTALGQVVVVRGGGPALATESTRIEHTTRGQPGIGEERTTAGVECEDALVVPVDVALATDDARVELSMDGQAFALSARADREPERFEASGDVDPSDLSAMPATQDPAASPGLSLQWTPDGELSSVSLWWDGADYEQVLETE